MAEHVEVHVGTLDGWKLLGTVAPDEPAGSITQTGPDGTEVYVFGWVDGYGPYVLRSIDGIHIDDVDDAGHREILTRGFDVIADLRTAPATLPFTGHTRTAPVRFTYQP